MSEKEYIEMMIDKLERSMIQASIFGDELSMESLRVQKAMYQAKLVDLVKGSN